MSGYEAFILFILTIAFMAICIGIAAKKGYSSVLGGVLGLFLGLIGVIIMACLPNRYKRQAEIEARMRQQQSTADELLKYKQLYDSGGITGQEYAEIKNRILYNK